VTVGAVVTVGETVAPVEVEALVVLGELEALQALTSANTDKTARAATRLISTSPPLPSGRGAGREVDLLGDGERHSFAACAEAATPGGASAPSGANRATAASLNLFICFPSRARTMVRPMSSGRIRHAEGFARR
jgi:hypothetical protein